MKREKETNILSKRSTSERVLFAFVFILFAIYALSLLYPLFYIFATSFKERSVYINDITEGQLFALPKFAELDFKNYAEVLKLSIPASRRDISLFEMLLNSLWYTAGSSLGGVLASSFTAYALSKYKFIGRNSIYAVIIFTMTIPIIGSTGSTLQLLSTLQIYNTPFFLMTALSGFGFNFMILYGFFKSLPWSYAEAVFIDGGGHFTAFFKIMLPQAKASIITLFIMAAIGAWNDYSTPLLYMPDFPTIASGLYELQTVGAVKKGDIPLYFAGLMMSSTPVVVLFACCSNTIMKNFTIGGLKG